MKTRYKVLLGALAAIYVIGHIANSEPSKDSEVSYTCGAYSVVDSMQRKSGIYNDGYIMYSLNDSKLESFVKDAGSEKATFDSIAADGSRKYKGTDSDYFVSVLNDNTIKVVVVNERMTVAQECKTTFN